jgi:hypothetical protein
MNEINEEPLLFSTINYFDMISRASRAISELNESYNRSVELYGTDEEILQRLREIAIKENNKKDFKFLTK